MKLILFQLDMLTESWCSSGSIWKVLLTYIKPLSYGMTHKINKEKNMLKESKSKVKFALAQVYSKSYLC